LAGNKTYTEQELVALLKSGSKEAFDVLYKNYAPALYGIISRIVKSDETAQDVLQETFVRVWRKMASYDSSKGSLFTWLLNIARNGAIDASRSKHEKNQIRDDELIVSIAESTGSEMNFDHIGIQEVVSVLKVEHKLIIDHLYIKGFTQEETAAALKLPLGTVKTRARTAILQLRELLKEKPIGR
jgi:RNA polymerase sigma-70 factor (ECF subfamily)